MARTALVVDDDEVNLRLCAEVLRAYGYQALEAADGAQALRLLETTRPDVALVDVQLRGASGLGLVEAIRARADLRSLPIIAVTGLASPQDRAAALAAGCNEYLSKPLVVRKLLETIDRCLVIEQPTV